MRRLVLVLLPLWCVMPALPAAAQTATDERAWFTASLQERSGTKSPWRWFGDVTARSREGVDDLDATALRGAIGYDLTSQSGIAGGYAFAQSYPASGGVTIEHRVFQQFQWRGRAGGVALSLRTRVEQRFIEGNSGMALRVREQARFSRPVRAGSRVSWLVWDELFLHANETSRLARGLDQNRAFAGMSLAASARASVEFGYLNQFSKSRTGANRSNHVLSGTLSLSY